MHHHNNSHDDFLEQMLSTLCNRGASTASPDCVLLPLPLSLGPGSDTVDSGLLHQSNTDVLHPVGDGSVEALHNGFAGSVHGVAQNTNHRHFHPSPSGFGAPASTSTGGSTGTGGQPRQKVRARRGQATDPHSIAERLRRERIAERMRALQELVPNANKTDKASMLDEIIDYVKFLQLQVKVMSMSRLGSAAAVAPHLVADLSSSSEGESGSRATSRCSNGTHTASGNNSMTVTEQQVAKLMEEDMGSAMQYLQGKGLCLMPISLATAISTSTFHSGNTANHHPAPPCITPSVSVLTVQSPTTAVGGGEADVSVKDATSFSHS